MSVSLYYTWIWKWVEVDGSLLQYFYWEDFNPTHNPRPSWWGTVWAYEATNTFDLSWFQPWHEVWCGIWNLKKDWDWSSETFQIKWNLQRLKNSTWTTGWDVSWSGTIHINEQWAWYMYFWVDDDEIWDWYSSYRIMWWWSTSWWDMGIAYSYFNVSNLDIDSNLYPSWCLWIDWVNLCYTDWTHWSEWYKHTIAYDSNVYDYVGRDAAWCIWMEDS